jgi:short subunit dehydrogenase-like uncharacterized protein
VANNREFDVIVWGATGFTGALVAEYLRDQYGVGGDLSWAIAGRNPGKLAQLKDGLGESCGALPVLQADSHDLESLNEMAARTTVVITTVGPYALHGADLVAACVENGTHYCDLAGEAHFIRRMIDAHDERARQTGARIVHCCGFDSVPMDIGAWFLQQEAHKRYGAWCESIKLLVKASKGGPSGGTIASMLNLIKDSRENKDVIRVLLDPYGLNPEGERKGPDGREQHDIRFNEDVDAWTAPFVMAAINTRVVRRSHALLGYPWGKGFRYDEAVITGKGVAGRLKAAMLSAGLGGIVLGASFGFTRKILQRWVLPEPGEGPTKEQRETGFFNLMQIGRLPDGKLIRTRITGDRDPGYGSTSKMLSECAVCLASDELETGGGVWTPASAMAEPLLRRLTENAGLSFDVVD